MTYTQRYMTHLPPVIIAGRTIKRYHLTPDTTPIPTHIQTAAYRHLPRLLPDHPGPTPPATVAILHQDKHDQTHLNTYTWTSEHHLTHARATKNPRGFTTTPPPTTGCLWELPALVHERSAWARHMLNTTHPNFDDYLADILAGVPIAA